MIYICVIFIFEFYFILFLIQIWCLKASNIKAYTEYSFKINTV